MPQHEDARPARVLLTVEPGAVGHAAARRRAALVIALAALASLVVLGAVWTMIDGAGSDRAVELVLAIVIGAFASLVVAGLGYEYPRLVWHPVARQAIGRELPDTHVWSCTPVRGVRELARVQTDAVIGVRGVLTVGPEGLGVWAIGRRGAATRVAAIEHARILEARWERFSATVTTGFGAVVRYRDELGSAWTLRVFLYRGTLRRRSTAQREFLAAMGVAARSRQGGL